MRFHTTNHLGHSQVLGRNICKQLKRLVGERGFEPPTPWSRTRCSTRLSHSPTDGSRAELTRAKRVDCDYNIGSTQACCPQRLERSAEHLSTAKDAGSSAHS